MAEFKPTPSISEPDVDERGCPNFCENGEIIQQDFLSFELQVFDCPHCKKEKADEVG